MAQFQLSEKEFIRGSLAIPLRRPLRQWILYVLALGLLTTLLVFKGHSVIGAIALCLGGLILLVAFIYLLATLRLKKIFREQQSLRELIDVTIDDQQLSYSWARGTYTLPWENVRRGLETRNFFILFESSFFARMLPKRALSQEETAIICVKTASKPHR
jgi:hypothetical protein